MVLDIFYTHFFVKSKIVAVTILEFIGIFMLFKIVEVLFGSFDLIRIFVYNKKQKFFIIIFLI
jgi:hypothetical protein